MRYQRDIPVTENPRGLGENCYFLTLDMANQQFDPEKSPCLSRKESSNPYLAGSMFIYWRVINCIQHVLWETHGICTRYY